MDEIRRVGLFTSGVVELTRHQAERVVKDFVKSGDVRRKQASSAVKELMETSKVARTELARLIRSEIQNQIEGLGLATKRDLERLDRRVARLETERKKAPAATASRKKTPAKKSTAKKSTAKKSTAKGQGSATSGNAASRPSSSS
ncbi:MAG TPA: hypothetical protein VE174_07100 [Actinomycetota bacterium]|nr:hypothetical protein [Actinomycetota bacterium]